MLYYDTLMNTDKVTYSMRITSVS